MAIYHLSIQAIRRSEGRNAIACAAYRAGCCLQFTRTGQWFDHSRRVGIQSALVMPIGVQLPRARGFSRPHELRGRLWNAAEDAETRINSVTARELNVAIPHELDAATGWDLALSLGRHLADAYGVAADVVMHPPSPAGDQRNLHAHIMWTTRTVSVVGDDFAFGKKTRIFDDRLTGPQEIVAIRHAWAGLANDALSDAGVVDDLGQPVRISPLSLVDQGIDREPTEHDGPRITNLRRIGALPSLQAAPVAAPSPSITPGEPAAAWPVLTEMPVEQGDPVAVAEAWISTAPWPGPAPAQSPSAAPALPLLSTILVTEGEVVGRMDPHRGAGRRRARLDGDTRVAGSTSTSTAPSPAPSPAPEQDDVMERTPGGPTAPGKPIENDLKPQRRAPPAGPVAPLHLMAMPAASVRRRRRPLAAGQPEADASDDVQEAPDQEEIIPVAAVVAVRPKKRPAGTGRGLGAALAKGKIRKKGKGVSASRGLGR